MCSCATNVRYARRGRGGATSLGLLEGDGPPWLVETWGVTANLR